MISNDAFYTVQGWMREELGLKGNALAVYAIIYGFSQDGASEYAGSSRYLCEWLGCSKNTVLSALAHLTEEGHIIKRTIYQNGVTFCNYVAARCVQKKAKSPGEKIAPPVQNLDQGGAKIGPGVVQNFVRGGAEIGPHIDRHIDRDINKDIYIGAAGAAPSPAPIVENDKKPVKHKYGEYKNVLLTDEEMEKLRAEFPDDLEERIERLSAYMASTGKPYKSHYATIRNWAKRDKQESKRGGGRGQAAGAKGPNGIAIDPTKTDLDGLF